MNVKSKENEGTTFTFSLPLDNLRKPSDSLQCGFIKPQKKESIIDSNKLVGKKIENWTLSNPSQGMAFKNSLFKKDNKKSANLNEIEESNFEEEEEKRSPVDLP